jgi:hypothetical protein
MTPKEQRVEARAQQLAALAEAAPKGAPERMRATIQINTIRVPVIEQRRIRKFFREDTFEYVETGEHVRYTVDMILQLPEHDRAIISEHSLDGILVEDEPRYTREELRQIEEGYRNEVEAAKDHYLKAAISASTELALDSQRAERKQTFLGDYLVAPFSREFVTAPGANEYADKLKTKILPQIRDTLERYRSHKKTDTIEF